MNASLFLFDTAEGLALEHFLGPKEAIGGDWDEFAKAWTIMTNLYGEYFGETLAAGSIAILAPDSICGGGGWAPSGKP